MRTGKRLALDVGKARIGVAVSDFHGILASPIGNLARLETISETLAAWTGLTESVDGLVGEEFIECYVGLPISLSGAETASTRDAVEFGTAFAAHTGIAVRYVDERLTTSTAAAKLRANGIASKQGRGRIDAAAATIILEQALQTERNTGKTPGLTGDEVNENIG
ncbi:MAG: hypothetical protein RL102_202 [Actinomycetota bacterium]|jgi:putative Holliday junction resolvase